MNFVLNQSASYDHEGTKGRTNPVLCSKAENIIREYQDKGQEGKIKKQMTKSKSKVLKTDYISLNGEVALLRNQEASQQPETPHLNQEEG